jgi:RNA polymerase sigma-70 factor (ECF subfamily)
MDAGQRASEPPPDAGSGADREARAAEIYRDHAEAVYARIRKLRWRLGFSEADCPDLTQETFVRAFCKLDAGETPEKLRPWLLRIAENVAKNQWRARRALKRGGEAAASGRGRIELTTDCFQAIASLGPDPLKEVLVEERYRQVRDAILRLPRLLRRPFLMRTVHGLSHQQIAEVLQIKKVVTVRTRIARARSRVRAMLGEEVEWTEGDAYR